MDFKYEDDIYTVSWDLLISLKLLQQKSHVADCGANSFMAADVCYYTVSAWQGSFHQPPVDVQFCGFQLLVMKSDAIGIFIFPSLPLLGCVSKRGTTELKGLHLQLHKIMPEFHPGLYLLVLEPIDLHLLQPLPM